MRIYPRPYLAHDRPRPADWRVCVHPIEPFPSALCGHPPGSGFDNSTNVLRLRRTRDAFNIIDLENPAGGPSRLRTGNYARETPSGPVTPVAPVCRHR